MRSMNVIQNIFDCGCLECATPRNNNTGINGKHRDGWPQPWFHHIWKNQLARKSWCDSRGKNPTMTILLQRLRVTRIYLRSWHRPPKHESNKRHLQCFIQQFRIDGRCWHKHQPVAHCSGCAISGHHNSCFSGNTASIQIRSFKNRLGKCWGEYICEDIHAMCSNCGFNTHRIGDCNAGHIQWGLYMGNWIHQRITFDRWQFRRIRHFSNYSGLFN